MMNEARTKLGLVFTHVASGLKHLHALGLVHRDIKPDNILVQQSDGEICFKLADFGFSNIVDQAFTLCGSPLYMAPEVSMRERQTARLDIYSLGVVLLQILGCFHRIRTPKRLPREGLQPIIWEEAVNFRPGNHEADFLRRMISRNAIHRPTATHCLQFLNRDVAQPSREKSRIETNPSSIAEVHEETLQLHDRKEPAHDHLSPPRNVFLPRNQRNGLVRNLVVARQPEQDSLKPKSPPGVTNRFKRRIETEGLQAEDLTQVAQILRATKPRITRRDRDCPRQGMTKNSQIQPNVIPEHERQRNVGRLPKVLQHQKRTNDGKIVKGRKIEPEKSQKRMPGSWVD
jgi:serine/threonine protein kinase